MPTIPASILALLMAGAALLPGADAGVPDLIPSAAFAALADHTLRIDTRTSDQTWNPCALTPPGRLLAGRSYVAQVTCRIDELGDDAFLLLLVRPAGADDDHSDLASAELAEVGGPRTLTLHFSIPAGRDDYALQVHTRHRLLAAVTALSIRQAPDPMIIPLAAPGQAVQLPALATGAEEFVVEQPGPATAPALSVADFGADPAAADNVAAFNRAIARCVETGAQRLVVPTGTYRFTSDAPLAFTGLADFTFDGQGSTFVFRKGRNELLRIAGCRRTRFTGFAIDWDWEHDPLASVVRVEAVAADHLDVRFIDYTRFPRRDVRVADIEQLDPATMSVGCENAVNAGFEFSRGKGAPHCTWLDAALLRIDLAGGQRHLAGRVRPGMLFRMRHYVYDMAGVVMQGNVHLTLAGVDVRSCPGHAFVSEGDQHHWQFLHCNIVPPPGVHRPITCTADHHHVARSQGFFRMEDCEFSLGGDDCLNVHDTTAFAEPSGPRTLRTRNLRTWTAYHPGDPIELRQDDYAPTGCTAPLLAIRPLDQPKGIFELAFAEDLPAATGSGFVLFNRRYGTRQVIVRNCYFHDNRARGLLLLGSDITVEGNRFFHNQMGAIKIETGYTFNVWSEGYGAANIVIRGNRFDTVNPMGSYRHELMPAIYMSVYLRTDPSQEKTAFPILHDILVEGNTFSDGPGAILYACSARNVVIRDNTVAVRTPRQEVFPYRGWVGVSYASGIFVTGNTWIPSPLMPDPSIIADPETTGGIHSWNNTVGAGP